VKNLSLATLFGLGSSLQPEILLHIQLRDLVPCSLCRHLKRKTERENFSVTTVAGLGYGTNRKYYDRRSLPGPCDVRFVKRCRNLDITKKCWRHSTWSANAKFCAYTGLSMSQTQKYPLAQVDHLLWTSSPPRRRLSVFGHIDRITRGTQHTTSYIAKLA